MVYFIRESTILFRDGIITNDKFCFIRRGVLHLRKRKTFQAMETEPPGCDILLEEHAHLGGRDEAGVDCQQKDSAANGWPTSMGSSLPVPPEMGSSSKSRGSIDPDQRGGVL
jgi:hypothetical protein